MKLLPGWKALCASSVGSSHRKDNIPLQDYGISVISPFPLLIMADGAGSVANSAIGAKTAVESSLDFISTNKFKADCREKCLVIYEAVLMALGKKAEELGVEISSMATTLIIVYAMDGFFHWINLGDGIIMAQKGRILGCVNIPCKGEFANETVFVTSSGAHNFLQCGTLPVSQFTAIMAFTDGLVPILVYQNNLFPAPVPAPACSSLISQLRNKPLASDDLQYLLENQFSYASDDDKTLGFLVRIS